MRNYYKKGITTVEILIVLFVLAIIFAIVIPQFYKIRENQVLKSAVGDVLSSINKARSQTLSSLDSSSYGVFFDSDSVIIFKGELYSSQDPNNETINIVSPAHISDVTLSGVSGESGELYFKRLSGIPSGTGAITVSTNSLSSAIIISATGTTSVD